MTVGKDTLKWKRAMAIARRRKGNLGLMRRRKIAGAILGGKRK